MDAGGSVAEFEKLKLTAILRDSAFGLGGSSCKATQLGGMENAPKGLARMILAEQVREALGHNEGEDCSHRVGHWR